MINFGLEPGITLGHSKSGEGVRKQVLPPNPVGLGTIVPAPSDREAGTGHIVVVQPDVTCKTKTWLEERMC